MCYWCSCSIRGGVCRGHKSVAHDGVSCLVYEDTWKWAGAGLKAVRVQWAREWNEVEKGGTGEREMR